MYVEEEVREAAAAADNEQVKRAGQVDRKDWAQEVKVQCHASMSDRESGARRGGWQVPTTQRVWTAE